METFKVGDLVKITTNNYIWCGEVVEIYSIDPEVLIISFDGEDGATFTISSRYCSMITEQERFINQLKL